LQLLLRYSYPNALTPTLTYNLHATARRAPPVVRRALPSYHRPLHPTDHCTPLLELRLELRDLHRSIVYRRHGHDCTNRWLLVLLVLLVRRRQGAGTSGSGVRMNQTRFGPGLARSYTTHTRRHPIGPGLARSYTHTHTKAHTHRHRAVATQDVRSRATRRERRDHDTCMSQLDTIRML